MLSLEDCLDFCELDSQEVEAIAEHEHIPIIVAAELGCSLLRSADGVRDLHAMLIDNIARARQKGHPENAAHWTQVYRQFQAAHPIGRAH